MMASVVEHHTWAGSVHWFATEEALGDGRVVDQLKMVKGVDVGGVDGIVVDHREEGGVCGMCIWACVCGDDGDYVFSCVHVFA